MKRLNTGVPGFLILCVCVVCACTLVSIQNAQGQTYDKEFRLSSISPMLMADAPSAVIRLDEQRFEVKNKGKATLTIHRAITIFDESAQDEGEFFVYYGDLRPLKKIEGVVRNAEGKVVRKLGKNNTQDYSAISGFSLYDDWRVRWATLFHNEFPYTVEYTYVIEFDGLLSWPTWRPMQSGWSVEYGRFEIDAPANFPVRYYVDGGDLEPLVATNKNRRQYTWEIQHEIVSHNPLIAALGLVELTSDNNSLAVHTAPEGFEIEGSEGNMGSWESFGAWYFNLYQGRDQLPESVIFQVQQSVKNLEDPVAKVERIYKDFQAATRYVSVQLGLGGWQPFEAMYVAENGYGDCKALTNYLHALLKVEGIDSHPVIIRAGTGEKEILPDFPSQQFNHVILAVPVASDTLWLEATSQTSPFNHLGSFTEDRYGLMVTPMGGKLVRTPKTTSTQNKQLRQATVNLDATGYATAEIHTEYTGNQQDRVRGALIQDSPRDRLEWLRHVINIPAFDIVSVDFADVDNVTQSVTIPFSLDLPRYASKSGKRLFVPTNLMHPKVYVPSEDDMPSEAIRLSYAYYDEDEIRFALPEGYSVEALPESVNLETPFSKYQAIHEVEEGVIVYKRILEFMDREIEPVMHGEYRDFLTRVARADRAQVVLVAN